MKKDPPVSFLVRIWREPTEASPEGEVRGIVQQLGFKEQRLFQSMEGLWSLLLHPDSKAEDRLNNDQE
jgi:hypothetical protein